MKFQNLDELYTYLRDKLVQNIITCMTLKKDVGWFLKTEKISLA